MTGQNRMSAMTALVIGIFGIGAITVASTAAIVLFGMSIVDAKVSDVLGIAQGTIEGLPDLIESAPAAIADILNDRRAPEYAADLDVKVAFVSQDRSGSVRPTLTITNKGNKVVSMLAIRVAALKDGTIPVREWTEVVATPIAIEDEWRGPLFPGSTRYVLLSSGYRGVPAQMTGDIVAAVEISEIRVWRPTDEL